MDYYSMKRKELQALCKRQNIPANLTNREMADRLSSLVKEEEKPKTRSQACLKAASESIEESDSAVPTKKPKKVRFSPTNETFEYVKLRSGVKVKTHTTQTKLMAKPVVKASRRKPINRNVDVIESVNAIVHDTVRNLRSKAQTSAESSKDPMPNSSIRKKRAIMEAGDASDDFKSDEGISVSSKRDLRSKFKSSVDSGVKPVAKPQAEKKRAREVAKDDTEQSIEIVSVPVRTTRSRAQSSMKVLTEVGNPSVEKKRSRRGAQPVEEIVNPNVRESNLSKSEDADPVEDRQVPERRSLRNRRFNEHDDTRGSMTLRGQKLKRANAAKAKDTKVVETNASRTEMVSKGRMTSSKALPEVKYLGEDIETCTETRDKVERISRVVHQPKEMRSRACRVPNIPKSGMPEMIVASEEESKETLEVVSNPKRRGRPSKDDRLGNQIRDEIIEDAVLTAHCVEPKSGMPEMIVVSEEESKEILEVVSKPKRRGRRSKNDRVGSQVRDEIIEDAVLTAPCVEKSSGRLTRSAGKSYRDAGSSEASIVPPVDESSERLAHGGTNNDSEAANEACMTEASHHVQSLRRSTRSASKSDVNLATSSSDKYVGKEKQQGGSGSQNKTVGIVSSRGVSASKSRTSEKSLFSVPEDTATYLVSGGNEVSKSRKRARGKKKEHAEVVDIESSGVQAVERQVFLNAADASGSKVKKIRTDDTVKELEISVREQRFTDCAEHATNNDAVPTVHEFRRRVTRSASKVEGVGSAFSPIQVPARRLRGVTKSERHPAKEVGKKRHQSSSTSDIQNLKLGDSLADGNIWLKEQPSANVLFPTPEVIEESIGQVLKKNDIIEDNSSQNETISNLHLDPLIVQPISVSTRDDERNFKTEILVDGSDCFTGNKEVLEGTKEDTSLENQIILKNEVPGSYSVQRNVSALENSEMSNGICSDGALHNEILIVGGEDLSCAKSFERDTDYNTIPFAGLESLKFSNERGDEHDLTVAEDVSAPLSVEIEEPVSNNYPESYSSDTVGVLNDGSIKDRVTLPGLDSDTGEVLDEASVSVGNLPDGLLGKQTIDFDVSIQSVGSVETRGEGLQDSGKESCIDPANSGRISSNEEGKDYVRDGGNHEEVSENCRLSREESPIVGVLLTKAIPTDLEKAENEPFDKQEELELGSMHPQTEGQILNICDEVIAEAISVSEPRLSFQKSDDRTENDVVQDEVIAEAIPGSEARLPLLNITETGGIQSTNEDDESMRQFPAQHTVLEDDGAVHKDKTNTVVDQNEQNFEDLSKSADYLSSDSGKSSENCRKASFSRTQVSHRTFVDEENAQPTLAVPRDNNEETRDGFDVIHNQSDGGKEFQEVSISEESYSDVSKSVGHFDGETVLQGQCSTQVSHHETDGFDKHFGRGTEVQESSSRVTEEGIDRHELLSLPIASFESTPIRNDGVSDFPHTPLKAGMIPSDYSSKTQDEESLNKETNDVFQDHVTDEDHDQSANGTEFQESSIAKANLSQATDALLTRQSLGGVSSVNPEGPSIFGDEETVCDVNLQIASPKCTADINVAEHNLNLEESANTRVLEESQHEECPNEEKLLPSTSNQMKSIGFPENEQGSNNQDSLNSPHTAENRCKVAESSCLNEKSYLTLPVARDKFDNLQNGNSTQINMMTTTCADDFYGDATQSWHESSLRQLFRTPANCSANSTYGEDIHTATAHKAFSSGSCLKSLFATAAIGKEEDIQTCKGDPIIDSEKGVTEHDLEMPPSYRSTLERNSEHPSDDKEAEMHLVSVGGKTSANIAEEPSSSHNSNKLCSFADEEKDTRASRNMPIFDSEGITDPVAEMSMSYGSAFKKLFDQPSDDKEDEVFLVQDVHTSNVQAFEPAVVHNSNDICSYAECGTTKLNVDSEIVMEQLSSGTSEDLREGRGAEADIKDYFNIDYSDIFGDFKHEEVLKEVENIRGHDTAGSAEHEDKDDFTQVEQDSVANEETERQMKDGTSETNSRPVEGV